MQYLLRTNCGKTANTDGEKELKIGTVNQKLDELAAASGNLKATVLASLMRATSPRLLKWIICIILKDLKVGSLLILTKVALSVTFDRPIMAYGMRHT